MKRFIVGLIVGLLLATAGIGLTSNNVIRIFIDDQEVVPDVPPVIIDGRVMVPARFVAEPLGATVDWDGANRVVVITSKLGYEEKGQRERSDGYYTGREIFNAILKKYPDLKQASGNLGVEPQQGEFRFRNDTGEMWVDGKKFTLPRKNGYFSIEPLTQAQILTSTDIQLLQ